METSPPIPIAEFDYRKPDYKDNQKKVLDSIKVKPISEIYNFNPGFQEIVEKNKDFYGEKTYILDKDHPENKIYFRRDRNNIVLIQNLSVVGDKTIASNSNILDLDSDKAFSISNLTVNGNPRENGVTTILYANKLFKLSEFRPNKFSGVVVWNESKLQKKAIDLKFGKGVGKISSFLFLFHELGHKFQFKNLDSYDKSISAKQLHSKNFLNNEEIDVLDKGKQLIKEEERNAWAFSLSVVTKLKSLGLDLTKGLNNEQIRKGVDLALLTYDSKLKHISGNEISNKARAEARGK